MFITIHLSISLIQTKIQLYSIHIVILTIKQKQIHFMNIITIKMTKSNRLMCRLVHLRANSELHTRNLRLPSIHFNFRHAC